MGLNLGLVHLRDTTFGALAEGGAIVGDDAMPALRSDDMSPTRAVEVAGGVLVLSAMPDLASEWARRQLVGGDYVSATVADTAGEYDLTVCTGGVSRRVESAGEVGEITGDLDLLADLDPAGGATGADAADVATTFLALTERATGFWPLARIEEPVWRALTFPDTVPSGASRYRHPAFNTPYPPTDDTFTGWVMTRVALGAWGRESLQEELTGIVEANEFSEMWPEDRPLELEEALALSDEVIEAHQAVVIREHPDVTAFFATLQALQQRGIAFSFGEAADSADGVIQGSWRAQELGATAQGYGYSHDQDLERLIVDGSLLIGFSDLSGDPEPTTRIGDAIAAALRGGGGGGRGYQ
ncbi:DUF6891 domain-containing protein [Dermacoccaceae bacterium W4C1]